ncbi:MAG: helix-turn-helix domain-containing protein [Candidatus Promineifilaceae bacterium]|nr:helix-turn-helix domain-containing protein [Candidatus Promineifilaceae bacterium]
MLRPDIDKWGQTSEDIRQLSIKADHPRSRERFQALYLIATGKTNATLWAQEINRDDQTVMGWIHRYNAEGPDALTYRHTGGHPPFSPQT